MRPKPTNDLEYRMSFFDLCPSQSQVLLIDVQERFVPAIPSCAEGQAVGDTIARVLKGAGLLSVPITISEQVPGKLGPTLPFLLEAAGNPPVLAKDHFSAFDDQALRDHLAELDRPQLIIMGVEAHVCILASVDDALRRGYQVVVIDDGIASRKDSHADAARETMRQLGAAVVPSESVLFRWQRIAGGDTFRAISKLVK